MPEQEELLLGRIAVAKGLLSSEQLDQCIRIQSSQSPPPPLGQVLLAHGYLTEEQLQQLLALQRSRLEKVDRATEKPRKLSLFGRLVLAKGWVTEGELNECLRIQAQLERFGKARQLGQIMVEKGYLTVAQVKQLLAEQDKYILRCPKCGTRYNVAGYKENQVLRCIKCNSILRKPRRLVHVSADATFYGDGLTDPVIGKTLGSCKILKRLGQGGMATVYLGKHLGLNKLMAVKILPPASAQNRRVIERFIHEARAAAKLEHPNIVQVYHVGVEDGYTFILMQYIDGQSLNELLHQLGRLNVHQALSIMKQTARGLAAAHRQGIIHRDVKPDNILINKDGRVRVSDFGLARQIASLGERKSSDIIAGTPYYMSPEHWRGKGVDARSDIYSLGATFYYALTGQHLFEAQSVAVMMKLHMSEPPKSPKVHEASLPDSVCTIILKMLQKSPRKRYQKMEEVVADIERVQQGQDPLAMLVEGKTVQCSFCGTINPISGRKCSVCGEYLHMKVEKIEISLMEDEIYCPSCKAILRQGVRQCERCGVILCAHCGQRLAGRTGYCAGCARMLAAQGALPEQTGRKKKKRRR
jgi:serine/threonine-protein kinase